MKQRSAIKNDLFAPQLREGQIDHLGDPLASIEACIDFQALARAVDEAAPREVSTKGGRPAYPTETLVRNLVLKRLNNLSDERMEFLLLDRLSYQRFCGLTQALNVPDRTTIWAFENRIGEAGATALFEGVTKQLLRKGFIARGGQMIDATLVPAPKQKISRKEKKSLIRTQRLLTGSPHSAGKKIRMPRGPRNMARATLATSFRSMSTRNTSSFGRSSPIRPAREIPATLRRPLIRRTRVGMSMRTGAIRPENEKRG